MTDHPIIFSGAMVRALLAGEKTQTRRLATSPLRRVEIGDRLYVRESWSGIFWNPENIDGPARELWATPKAERTTALCSGAFYKMTEDAKPAGQRFVPEGQWVPSIHMPRWASRITLTVMSVNVAPLMPISEADARAEGLIAYRAEELPGHHVDAWHWLPGVTNRAEMFCSPSSTYAALWGELHTKAGERWQDNPDVVALTFSVERGNIDRMLDPPG